jgi:acyl-coenzyme A synthetase/AMP-(fatty) acid ligase
LVAFYLTNSPDFIFAWLGLWAIGAAPAMINHNLEGMALLHCLKISDARILLVDHDPVLAARIQNSAKEIEEELGMEIISLDKGRKKEIFSFPALRPGNEYRDDVKGDEPMCLLYTRYSILLSVTESVLTGQRHNWPPERLRLQHRPHVPSMFIG